MPGNIWIYVRDIVLLLMLLGKQDEMSILKEDGSRIIDGSFVSLVSGTIRVIGHPL